MFIFFSENLKFLFNNTIELKDDIYSAVKFNEFIGNVEDLLYFLSSKMKSF